MQQYREIRKDAEEIKLMLWNHYCRDETWDSADLAKLTAKAFTEGARVYVSPDARAESEMPILTTRSKQLVREESIKSGGHAT